MLATALKRGALSSEATTRALVDSMTLLNREASELMLQHDPHACTDITGYGLIGHGNEMAEGSDVPSCCSASAVPVSDGAREAADAGYLTGGGKATRRFWRSASPSRASVGETMTSILFDAQTVRRSLDRRRARTGRAAAREAQEEPPRTPPSWASAWQSKACRSQ